ncbi:serine/threonine-protein phosphatase 2a regulatory subunit b [Anaeramoeba flamelloides]|uniref:Serine/threonine-protein phosphatase 2A activator n=1 Tax=Anaeramoeba flamelloides TaxID=1746091 RepID=A0AAV8ADK3_9EUKA|nr:serine/threonine-protein phosphatase 2a regulatory subunit b [Anaeramoeba flamelloides]
MESNIPTKKIKSSEDLKFWFTSDAYYYLTQWIRLLSLKIKDLKNTQECKISDTVQNILNILDQLSNLIDKTPPDNQPTRFGNKAYRTWTNKLLKKSEQIVTSFLPEKYSEYNSELGVYFLDSFGNPRRIDYGSGHEINFICFLFCFYKLGVVTDEDLPALILKVFVKYLQVARKLQKVYNLEPAGSHGVWGLDDFQFLPYYFGSSQLIGHRELIPSSIHDKMLLKEHSDEYLYFRAIQYIHEIKTGPFFEHSPILNEISNVATWRKVNSGLYKMYLDEVLAKYPIVQHCYFGKLLPFTDEIRKKREKEFKESQKMEKKTIKNEK